jgi:NitT/TauT family transport system substrate-binding protein
LKAIRIGYLSTAYHTSFILIGTDWIKKKMKIKADWRLFPTGPEMIKAFIKGELDIGYIGLPPAMIGIDKGLAIKCIAGGHMEGTVFTAKKDFKTFSELGSVEKVLQQFKGKTIGTPTKGSIHDVIIRNLLEKSGLQQDITIRNFSWADQILEAMEDNEVDGGVGTPPLSVLASKLLGAKVMLPPHLMWPNNPSYGIVATLDMIENSSHTLESFLKLHEGACNLIITQPRQAANTAAKTLGTVDRNFVLEVYGVSPKYCASLSKEYIDSTLAFVPFLQKTGYIKSPLDTVDIFYAKLIEKIHPEKPHYGDSGVLSG